MGLRGCCCVRQLQEPASSLSGAVRAILETLGVQDVLCKCMGTQNPHNVVRATVEGLLRLKDVREVARLRGLPVEAIDPAAAHMASETGRRGSGAGR